MNALSLKKFGNTNPVRIAVIFYGFSDNADTPKIVPISHSKNQPNFCQIVNTCFL